jgi:RNA polymerase sigma-70 factor (ECF subfamily)
LQLALEGSDDAFAQLVEAFQRPVFNVCYRLLGDRAEAEDASQETFLRAYRNLRSYDPQRKFSTWLLSIASHYCIDRLRRRRVPWASLEELPAEGELSDTAPGPEAVSQQRDSERRVEHLLRRLGTQDRSVIVLRYWHDMGVEEIAQTLSLTESAVKSRLHRARKELASRWLEAEARHGETERVGYESPAV